MIGIAPAWLAFMFGWHIAMVNLGIGLAWLVPYLKNKAVKENDRDLERAARSLMRFYAATYGLAGVFGTAFTVFLLSYYPDFIGVAGHIALIPFAISILMIALHFFSIIAYWYGWDRWSHNTHNLIGLALGVSALLIPFGFRGVFAFLNIPAGLMVEATPAGTRYGLDLGAAIFANPTTLPLYVKSIAAAFTVTFFAVMGGYAYRYAVARTEEDRRYAARIMRIMAKPAVAGAVLMIVLGLWYALSLQVVPYKFNNVFASLGWRTGPDPTPYYNVAWLFVLKMLLFAVQLAAVALAVPRLLRGESLTEGQLKLITLAGVAAVLTVPLGEYLNAFSQYPFFIAAWPDVLAGHVTPQQLVTQYGVKITPPEALPAVIEKVNSIVLVDGAGSSAVDVLQKLVQKYPDNNYFRALLAEAQISVNEIAVLPAVVYLTYAFVAFLTASAVYLLYIVLSPRPQATVAAVEAEH